MDFLYNIFVYPIFVFLEVCFDNIFILTIPKYLLMFFSLAFCFNVLFLTLIKGSIDYSKDNKKTGFFVFLVLILCFFYGGYSFFNQLDIIGNYPSTITFSRFVNFPVNLSPLILIINLFSCGKILKFFDNEGKNYLYKLFTYSAVVLISLLSWKMPYLYHYFLLFNALFFLLFSFGPDKKIVKNIFAVSGLIAILPLLFELITKVPLYKSIISDYSVILICGIFIYYLFRYVFAKNTVLTEKINDDKVVLLSLFAVFIWSGLYITTMIIGSSPTEFSYISDNPSPFVFVFNTITKALGVFVLFPFLLYKSSDKKFKNILIILFVSFLFISILNINSMVLLKDFSTLSLDLKLDIDNLNIMSIPNILTNLVLCLILFLLAIKLVVMDLKENKNTVKNTLTFFVILGLVLSFGNIFKIFTEYQKIKAVNTDQKADENLLNLKMDTKTEIKPIITLTKTGKNVLIVFIDRGIGSIVENIFDTNPELKEIYSGFTYYPNTVSFYGHTILGYPPMIAGYEYTPDEINKRTDKMMVDKYNEALLMLPLMFKNNGYKSIVIEPPYENYEPVLKDGKIFEPYKIEHYVLDNDVSKFVDKTNMENSLKRNFIFFDIFMSLPSVFKKYIYQNGFYKYLKPLKDDSFKDDKLMKEYIKFLSLQKLTKISDTNENTFTVFNNDMLHINKYNSDYSEEHYELEKEAIMMFADYIKFLKENNVYDNTRIIIVSDHGHWKQNNEKLNKDYTSYNPILFFKDFNAKDSLKFDMTFMTNADTPLFAVKDIIYNPVNPFTNKDITKQTKKSKVRIYTDIRHTPDYYRGTTCLEKGLNYIEVHDNIFDDNNWLRNKL